MARKRQQEGSGKANEEYSEALHGCTVNLKKGLEDANDKSRSKLLGMARNRCWQEQSGERRGNQEPACQDIAATQQQKQPHANANGAERYDKPGNQITVHYCSTQVTIMSSRSSSCTARSDTTLSRTEMPASCTVSALPLTSGCHGASGLPSATRR